MRKSEVIQEVGDGFSENWVVSHKTNLGFLLSVLFLESIGHGSDLL